jgi:acetyl esterase/lipase
MPGEDILTLTPTLADERVPYGEDPYHFGDLRLPKGKDRFPLAVNIHGGFWRAKYDLIHAGHLCAALTALGIATWNLEYRRVGNPGGGWPGTFEDIRRAYRFLPDLAKRYPLDLSRVVLMGHSAGGHLALCLAGHEPSLKSVVALAGVTDLQQAWQLHLSNNAAAEFLRGDPKQVPGDYREANPMELSTRASQWLIHGLMDDVVPPSFSRDYVARKKGRGEDVHLEEIARADHFDLIDPRSKAWPRVEQIVHTLLK